MNQQADHGLRQERKAQDAIQLAKPQSAAGVKFKRFHLDDK